MIDFGGNGGTLTAASVMVSPTQLAGTGTIITRGLVSDIDLRFDSSHGLNQVIPLQRPGQDITVSLDATGASPLLGAGCQGSGSLTVSGGIAVKSSFGYVGWGGSSTGVATVSGSGSTWSVINGQLHIGYYGSGTLSISNGGSATTDTGIIGSAPGSMGVVAVGGRGSTWVSNGFIVGYHGSGTMSVINGGTVNGGVTVGSAPGSMGVVTVDGAGSTWASGGLMVGYYGSGRLSITNGGSISSSASYIGDRNRSKGMATVAGAGSTWAIDGSLRMGGSGGGDGALSIIGGGTLAATGIAVGNTTSLLAIDVGRGSSLTVGGGAGTLTNNGSVRILAGAGVPADGTVYSPISTGTWGGSGTCQAVGGTWDAMGHTFTPSSVTTAASGSPVELDLATVQRALVSGDGPNGTNWQLGASFPAAETTANMLFTAAATDGTLLDALTAVAGEHREVLDAWTFSMTDYTLNATNPIYFSLNVGSDFSTEDVNVWSCDGGAWAAFVPIDLTYDGTYVSFTATGMSGFAVTTVPEPGTLALLFSGLVGLVAYALRKRRRVA